MPQNNDRDRVFTNTAECPFSVRILKAPRTTNIARGPGTQIVKRQTNTGRWRTQESPFASRDKHPRRQMPDIDYAVAPLGRWRAMQRYRNFRRKHHVRSMALNGG